VLRAFSALLQKKPGFPLVAIIAMSVMGALILCLVIVLVWLAKKKNSRKSVGKLMYQPNQLLINNKFGLAQTCVDKNWASTKSHIVINFSIVYIA